MILLLEKVDPESDSTHIFNEIAQTLTQLGDTYAAQHKTGMAEESYNSALEIHQKMYIPQKTKPQDNNDNQRRILHEYNKTCDELFAKLKDLYSWMSLKMPRMKLQKTKLNKNLVLCIVKINAMIFYAQKYGKIFFPNFVNEIIQNSI